MRYHYVQGLFSSNHLDHHLDDAPHQPRLEEMTEAALKMLQESENKGFFLVVKGGRIDQAHHQAKAAKALDETEQFTEAVKCAYKMTDPKDTLIVVTVDHAHNMTISGYLSIGNSITGIGTDRSEHDVFPVFEKWFGVLEQGTAKPKNLSTSPDFGNKDFQIPAAVPLKDETHYGDDVAVYVYQQKNGLGLIFLRASWSKIVCPVSWATQLASAQVGMRVGLRDFVLSRTSSTLIYSFNCSFCN